VSTYDYAALRDGTVAALLTKFGASATLKRWTKGAYDKATATFGAGSTTNYAVTVVVSDYDVTEIDGTLVQRGDKQIIMGGAEQAPTLNDKITSGGVEYEIIAVNPIAPDGATVVAYFMQVRK
jgi:hypothetical protein